MAEGVCTQQYGLPASPESLRLHCNASSWKVQQQLHLHSVEYLGKALPSHVTGKGRGRGCS